MANDNQGRYEQSANPLGSLIKTAIGLAPIGYGAYRMMGEVKTNAALNPGIPFGVGQASGGNLPQVGRNIGANLAAGAKDNRQADLIRMKKLVDDVMADDSVSRIMQATSEQNALIQSLLQTMDDPSSEFTSTTFMNQREQLMNLARETNPDQLKEVLQRVMTTINQQGSDNTKLRMEKNFREFKKVGEHLTPPGRRLDATHMPNILEPTSLTGSALKRYNSLVSNLGSGGANRVQVVSTMWGGDQQIYARVYSGRAGKGGSFVDVLPLKISQGDTGLNAIFTNENLTTGYSAPKRFIDDSKIDASHTTYKQISKHAGVDIEDFIANEFFSRLKMNADKGQAYLPNAREFKAWKTQALNVLPRLSYSMNDVGSNKHIQKAHASSQNIAYIFGLDKLTEDQRHAHMLRLATIEGFEAFAPGFQYLTNGMSNQAIGRIGIKEGSPFEAIQSVATPTRGYFPVESRIEQIFGRDAIFVGHKDRKMGRGRHVYAGARATKQGSVIHHLGHNVEWSEALTGATNKMMVLDTRGDVSKSLGGTGAAYTTGKERVVSFTTKPILDPGSQNYMSSKLFMDEIISKAQANEYIRLSRADIQKHGAFLGFGPEGSQFMRMDPRTVDMEVAYNVTEAHGKRQVNIMARVTRDMEVFKGFSTMHKGSFISMAPSDFRQMIHNRMGLSRGLVQELNVQTRNMVVAPGDMLKKGAGFFDLQLRSGYGLLSKNADWSNELKGLAATHHYPSLPTHRLGMTLGGVIKGLSTSDASTESIGLVLGGIFHKGGSKAYLSGMNSAMAIEQADIEAAIHTAFGARAPAIISQASKGLALAAASVTQGMGPGDYALGRGSVEPRFITNLQHRFKNMGFSTDASADLIGQIYRQKIGFGPGLKSASGLWKLVESLTGQAGVFEGLDRTKYKTFDLTDLTKLSKDEFKKVISANPEGIMLDLTSGADNEATRAIVSNARDVFGQGQLFLPGSDVVDAMKDTLIKTARDISGNTSDKIVHDEYTRNVDELLSVLSAAKSQTMSAPATSKIAMETFKNRMIDLTSRSVMGLARGKVRGLQSMYALPYDLDRGIGMGRTVKGKATSRELDYARKIFKHAKGHAGFMDTLGFMSQLNDYMGNQNVSTGEAARKAERFFLSGEKVWQTGKSTHARGILQIATRHPELGLGNITPLQIFRHAGEVGRTSDIDRAIFKSVNANNKYGKINSWQDVMGLSTSPNSNLRGAFFHDFVDNLRSLAPEGGGSIFLPTTVAEVKIAGMQKAMSVDFGVSGAAIGDFDGDQWMSMMVNNDVGKKILSSLRADSSGEFLKADTLYKIKSHIFGEEAKDALAYHNKDKGVSFFDSPERIKEALRKEDAAKGKVGSLDTRLNKMRMSLLDLRMNDAASRGSVDEAMALLKILQEHAVIKGKKLPVYLPFADMLTNSIDEAFRTGSTDVFEDVMKTQIFPNSKLLSKEGMTIESVNTPYSWGNKIANERVSLQEPLDLIRRAVATAKITGVADSPSANWMSLFLKKSPEEAAHYMSLAQAGGTLETAMLRGSEPVTGKAIASGIEHTMRQMGSTIAAMDRRLLGIGAMAVAGSLAVMGAVGQQGYAPKPMVAEGEVVNPEIRRAMGEGRLLDANQNTGIPMIESPINTPTTYLSAPNAYQVRGNVSSINRMGAINNYLGSIGSGTRGSITVRDNRQSITPNYVDRLMGF